MLVLFCLVVLPAAPACVQIPREQVLPDGTVVVIADEEDSNASLAATYLSDPDRDWIITGFNRIDQPTPGQPIAVPAAPFSLGGVNPNGYQVVPVLAYERFSRKKTGKWVVSAADFESQLRFLKENGYRTIAVDDFFEFLQARRQIPEKAILITIDDGWQSTYDIAFPLLNKYGFTATLFVYTGFIGSKGALSWGQLEEMAAGGFAIECKAHTKGNIVQRAASESLASYFQRLKREVAVSRRLIREKIGRPSYYVAYPYGNTNPLFTSILKKEGVQAAFTLSPGENPFFVDRFALHRTAVSGESDLAQFQRQLLVFREGDLQ